jgi:oxygen-independent coproporphyrinogen-3 oxidase
MMSLMWRNLFGLEIDREDFNGAFDTDVYEAFEGVWKGLQEFEFVEVTPHKIKLVGDGPFYTPLIQTLLAEARYRELKGRIVAEAAA